MPIELFIFLGLVALLYLATRGADKAWRESNGIQPMSKEDARNNETLRQRRKARED